MQRGIMFSTHERIGTSNREVTEHTLACRIACIVVGGSSEQIPYRERSSGTWHLDCRNNWFLSIYDDGTAELRYRYAGTYSEEFWKAMGIVLENLLA